MSNLRLRIDKYLEGDESRPPKVFAKIYPLSESGAKRTSSTSAKQAMIPISHLPAHATSIDLEPGRYYVEAVLPSGEILSDDVEVRKPIEDLVLSADDSPHEWLGWQHLVGNVQTTGYVPPMVMESAPPPSTRRATGRKKGRRRAGTVLTKGPRATGRAFRKGGGDAKAKGVKVGRKKSAKRSRAPGGSVLEAVFEAAPSAPMMPPPELDLDKPIAYLSHPHPPLVNHQQGHLAWPWLADLSVSDPNALVHALNENQQPFEVPPVTRDATRAVFRVSWSSSYQGNVESLENRVAKASRCFAVVPRRTSVELVSLPIPWKVVETEREADIEVAIQEPSEPGGFCSSAVARDEELGTLLGYLSSGALPTARQMAETAKLMLYDKFINPFAAAAGAYALVGTALQATDREWHDWVRNLMNSFPHIPDGAIQWGQLNLRMRRSAEDFLEAKNAFKIAYKRGLPFYSMGMRWLLDGLESAARDDAEAEEMLRNVRRLAWRTHYQQPFTIIRLGGDQSV